jgi:lauroyl/myristoyl acyltransferase
MSLSKFIQSKDVIQHVPGKSPDELRTYILERGLEWCDKHPQERNTVEENLSNLNFPVSKELISNIQKHTVLHYYEKMLPFSGGPEFYFNFLKEYIHIDDEVSMLRSILNEGKGILIALAHFGAIEVFVPRLTTYKLPLYPTMRFATGRFSEIYQQFGHEMTKKGLAGEINFIEIGKPGTNAALEMAAALRKEGVLVTVFDEKTDYSIPVKLFGREVWGGAGLDKLIKFAGSSIVVFNAYMIRTGPNKFKLKLIEVDTESENPIQSMFTNLEKVVKDHLEQWYFLHEEIPFIDNNSDK